MWVLEHKSTLLAIHTMTHTHTHTPYEHVPELSKLTVTLVLHFNKAPLCLTTKNLLTANGHFTITTNHSKGDVLLRGGGGAKKIQ